MIKYSVILAVNSDLRGIGYCDEDGKFSIPWTSEQFARADQLNFRNLTVYSRSGKPNILIMGRNTYETMKNLFGDQRYRIPIVITTTASYEGIVTVSSFDEALKACEKITHESVFVVGGARIYDTAFERNDYERLYLTVIRSDTDRYVTNIKLSKIVSIPDTMYFACLEYYYMITGPNQSVYNPLESEYLKLLNLLLFSEKRMTRNGWTRASFGHSLRFSDFPLLTTKKVNWQAVFHELHWFLSGNTNIEYLHEHGVKVWDLNAKSDGSIGPMYGKQLREFEGKHGKTVDQVANVLHLLKTDPTSRRIMMTTYNPAEADEGVLYPCHGIVTQFFVNDGKLSLATYQRSADLFLGVTWNLVSYYLMMLIFAKCCDLEPGDVIYHFGDIHLYENHVVPAMCQLMREIQEPAKIKLLVKKENPVDYTATDFEVSGYYPQTFIKAEMSV